jgi:hypothetical protein
LVAAYSVAPGAATRPGQRDDVDDVADARLAHDLECGECPVDRPVRVYVERQTALMLVVVPPVPAGEDPRAIDPRAQRSSSLQRGLGRALAGRRIGHIEQGGERRRVDPIRGLRHRSLGDVGHMHRVAEAAQLPGQFEPQASCGTRHHSTAQRRGHWLS